jgi:hypothetical protein
VEFKEANLRSMAAFSTINSLVNSPFRFFTQIKDQSVLFKKFQCHLKVIISHVVNISNGILFTF